MLQARHQAFNREHHLLTKYLYMIVCDGHTHSHVRTCECVTNINQTTGKLKASNSRNTLGAIKRQNRHWVIRRRHKQNGCAAEASTCIGDQTRHDIIHLHDGNHRYRMSCYEQIQFDRPVSLRTLAKTLNNLHVPERFMSQNVLSRSPWTYQGALSIVPKTYNNENQITLNTNIH